METLSNMLLDGDMRKGFIFMDLLSASSEHNVEGFESIRLVALLSAQEAIHW